LRASGIEVGFFVSGICRTPVGSRRWGRVDPRLTRGCGVVFDRKTEGLNG
jgi:hypothetical protein